MQDKNIFQGYEIGGFELGPRLYKIVTAATVLTLLPIIALGQTNLFSTSACDSPFVNKVCDVLDTVYVGTKILAKDTGYSDGTYENVQLTENIWVEETETEPQLAYPIGYFEIANRDELAAMRALQENPDSGFNPSALPPINNTPITPPTPKYNIPRARSNRGRKKPVFPKKRNKVLEGDIGDDPIGDIIAGNNDSKKPENSDNKKPETNKKPEGDATATRGGNDKPKQNPIEKHTAKKSDPINDKPINREPLRDFGYVAVRKVENKQVDLSQQFKVRMNGIVTEEGLLDPRSQFVEVEGDPAMTELAKLAIEKVGVSGWLKYLVDEGAQRLDILFGQNNEQMIADVRSDLKDVNKAKTAASGLRGLIQATKIAHKNNIQKIQPDEYELLNAVKVSNEGSILVIKFNLPKEDGQRIINNRMQDFRKSPEYAKRRQLEDKANSSGKPSGSVDKKAGEANAGR